VDFFTLLLGCLVFWENPYSVSEARGFKQRLKNFFRNSIPELIVYAPSNDKNLISS
jgi:hypothetical protein